MWPFYIFCCHFYLTDLEIDGFNAKHPYFQCIVAELDGTIDPPILIGYAIYYFTYSTWIGKSIYLEDIYVMPEYRKLGLGSVLFSRVTEVCILHINLLKYVISSICW